MKKAALFIAVCILMSVFLVACSSGTAPATFAATQARPQPSHTAPPTATIAPSATHTPPPQPTASPTRPAPTVADALPTETALATAIPGDWRVPVVNVPDLIGRDYYFPFWVEQNNLINWGEGMQKRVIDPVSGKVVQVIPPTPTPARLKTSVSPTGEIQIMCEPGGLRMVRIADQSLIAAANLRVDYCERVVWASHGFTAAIVTEDGGIYVWLREGAEPDRVGAVPISAQVWSTPIWSPDNTQILVYAPWEGEYSAELITYRIVYPDGRAMVAPGTPIQVGNEWEMGLEWITSTILRNKIGCTLPNYCLYDFYDAQTGRFIIHSESTEWGGGREPMLSPDGSWLVSEASESDTIWKPRWERNADSVNESWFGLVVTDLQRLRRSIVIEPRPFKGVRPTPSEDAPPPRSDSLKFLGWNVDSDRFYLIYFPVGLPVYELPAGLLVMNPKNGYIEAVVPAVVFGLISPDHEHVFLVTAETIQENRATGMKAAIYRLDGTPITALQPLSASIEYDVLNEMDIYSSNATRLISSEWSPDGTQLVYADTGGNIWVMDTTGNTTLLTANLPKESWDGKAIFSWSPDGQYLLIKSKEYAWIADISAGQRFPGAMKYYYCSTLVEGSEGTRESPYDCGNDVKVSNVVEIVCKQGGGTLYVHHAGMTSNFYEVLLISPNCQVQKKGEFEGSPPSH